jgi:hypothetical protein
MRICEEAAGLTVSQHSRQRDRVLLNLESRAIQSVQDAINAEPLAIDDGVIMSAFAIASHPPQRKYERFAWQPKPPLWNMQWMGFYTDVVFPEGHVQGLSLLIEARGGLDAIQLPGLAETLSV